MLRIVSDTHGLRKEYLEIIEDCDYSLQIGDLGFDYSFLENVDAIYNKVIAGNHNNHEEKKNFPHFLRDYGTITHSGIEFFYLEGGFSIDQEYRREQEQLKIWPKTWWDNEELPQEKLEDALKLYKEVRPDVLISHEPPRHICDILSNANLLIEWGFDPKTFTTRTSEALQRMIEEHAPKLHIFGHFHMNFDKVIKGTRFVCQEELGYLDLDNDLSLTKYLRDGTEYE